MAEITISAEIEVKCTCGRTLDASLHEYRNGGKYLECEPCSHCKDEAHANGNGEGYHERDEEVANLIGQIQRLVNELNSLEQLNGQLPDSAGEWPPRLIQH